MRTSLRDSAPHDRHHRRTQFSHLSRLYLYTFDRTMYICLQLKYIETENAKS
ncbi:hypothetical protein BofuT4_uP091780.1 [Botrytis cinerea T4]|uniref:Uncharacterized protein n=1 Tax=Botryotinia fuckeliana (strain T4) TaxID=999810 RepID=G2YEM1_BOTF4|nr:hypothetical protein BofuT4_uP091780.1 [Botrytis cinerea T4]